MTSFGQLVRLLSWKKYICDGVVINPTCSKNCVHSHPHKKIHNCSKRNLCEHQMEKQGGEWVTVKCFSIKRGKNES